MSNQIVPLLLPPKPLSDSRLFTFDLKRFPEVAPTSKGGLGLPIIAASVTSQPVAGLSIGAAAISGTLVQVRITSTLIGTYELTIVATTSAGDVLTTYATLDVCPAPLGGGIPVNITGPEITTPSLPDGHL